MLTLSSRVNSKPGVVFAEVDGRIVLLDPSLESYYSFNGTASYIWRAIAQPCAVAALTDRLTAAFEIDRDACVTATLSFLSELESKGLVDTSA